MTAETSLTHAELDAALGGSLVHEELLDQIIDVSRTIPLEFSDRLGTASTGNKQFDWTLDRLRTPADSRLVDGQDMDQNDTGTGARVANQVQINGKEVRTSLLGEAANSVGMIGRLAAQVSRRGRELEQDCEAWYLGNNAGVIDDGDTTAGATASLEAQIDDQVLTPGTQPPLGPPTQATWNADSGSVVDLTAGSIAGGGLSNYAAGVVPAYTYTTPAAVAITEAAINGVVQALYENTGSRANRLGINRTKVHSAVSAYYFTSSARIATLTSETTQTPTPATAKGAVNAILTDYGVVDLVADVFQPLANVTTDECSTMFILDMGMIEQVNMTGFRVTPLAKDGLYERRLLTKAAGLRVLSNEAQGMIQGIDDAVPMTA